MGFAWKNRNLVVTVFMFGRWYHFSSAHGRATLIRGMGGKPMRRNLRVMIIQSPNCTSPLIGGISLPSPTPQAFGHTSTLADKGKSYRESAVKTDKKKSL
ncbi:hypothetical protein AVEN_125636-1 [Araneus ventricosus]|uniref:Uncharacterized protein n=1 Tax=Araneus ventricosus TaxID=182803 RepID=A0A4Y2MUG2_ARAVE|nr:hypothetical protein AVEN_125636-1 [Araneus ventricosus]